MCLYVHKKLQLLLFEEQISCLSEGRKETMLNEKRRKTSKTWPIVCFNPYNEF